MPAILGRDVSGVVMAVGSEVRTSKPGDHVIAMAYATYAEVVAAPAAIVTHLPDGVDPIAAPGDPACLVDRGPTGRVATQVAAGQTILVSGALGSVGRAAVHTANKLGAKVIVGVRARQLAEAESLAAHAAVALDHDEAIARLDAVDGVADTVGGAIAAKLLRKVRAGALAMHRCFRTMPRRTHRWW